MNKGGIGIKMSAADLCCNRGIALNNAHGFVRKIIKNVLLDYYTKHGKSFKGFDYKSSSQEMKAQAKDILMKKILGVSGINESQIDRIIESIRNTTIDHFMQEINLKAYNQFSSLQVDDDFEDR